MIISKIENEELLKRIAEIFPDDGECDYFFTDNAGRMEIICLPAGIMETIRKNPCGATIKEYDEEIHELCVRLVDGGKKC